jgi:tellurite resistance protein TehA-like permease
MPVIAERLKKQIQGLSPVYFALVMATGIVSIGCHFLELNVLSMVLFYLNQVQYVILLLMLLLRISLYFTDVKRDLTTDITGPGFLTFVAGSCVLGIQYCLLAKIFEPGLILWIVSLLGWLLIGYTFLTIITIKERKPSLPDSLNGGWLLFTVSTQGIAILGIQLIGHVAIPIALHLFITLAAFFLGLFFYLLLISIVFFRLAFDPLPAKAFTPPYWVMMGAAAISALSGATLVLAIPKTILFNDLVPVLKGLTLMLWVVASWWIPLLAIIEMWRYFYKKFPLRYSAANWDTVFTLGMYTVCTYQLSKALHSAFLSAIYDVFIDVALLVWLITFLLMLKHLIRQLFFMPKKQ